MYDHRKAKFLQIGRDQGFKKLSNSNDTDLSYKESGFNKIKFFITQNKLIYIGIILVLIASIVSFIY